MKKIFSICLFAILYSNTYSQTYQQKMATFLNLLDNYYVSKPNMDSLVELGIEHILQQLDPHSVYMDAEEIKKANEPLEGNFEGVGIQFQIYKDTILVVHVISGGPSQKVGVLDGDKIVYIDTTKVAGVNVTNDIIFKKLRGKKGTKVTIKVKRQGEPELLEFEIIRDKIPIYAIEAQYMANKEIGYVKLSRFSATATEEVQAAIDTLKKQGAKKLILDLTSNGGGYLTQAHSLSDLFLSDGKLVVYSEGRSQPKIDLNATAMGNFESGDLVIMIDQFTASASEIVSGAVQDWDRGILVGRRTFGKGLVQKGYSLPDYSAVRLTMAHYYTPSGRCIQKPYVGGELEKYSDDFEDRYASGELFDSTKMKVVDSTKYYTTHKRIVYGGGGVMPDVFVPVDTTWSSKFYGKLVRTGSFNLFGLEYVNNNRNVLTKKYPTLESYMKNFNVDDVINEFYEFAKIKKAIPDSLENYTKSVPSIKNQLKAIIAQNIWNSTAYYQITNEQNPIYIKALEVFTNGIFQKLNIDSGNTKSNKKEKAVAKVSTKKIKRKNK